MTLRNRVTPLGEIVATPERGLFMGNRGRLHDRDQNIVRPHQVRRWLICVTEFRGRRRALMQPGSYTELFFLDEPTALAAGHRPCAECRHDDYLRFKLLWRECHPADGSGAGADAIDTHLHRARLADRTTKRTYTALPRTLPGGCMVRLDDRPWLVHDGELLGWSPSGYEDRRRMPEEEPVEVLTPRPTVAVLAAGYRPTVGDAAGSPRPR